MNRKQPHPAHCAAVGSPECSSPPPRAKPQWLRAGLAAALAASSLLAGSALAQEQWRPTDIEMKMLPPYCHVRFEGKKSREYARWSKALGPGFLHVHHYCAGLNFLLRAYRANTPKDKSYNLNLARGNLTAVISGVPSNFALLPDIYLDRGITYAMLKHNNRAVEDLTKAIQLNPRLVKAYVNLADVYVSGNQKNLALEVVLEGMRRNPDAPPLKRRYVELGGNPSALPASQPAATGAPSVATPSKETSSTAAPAAASVAEGGAKP